MRTQRLLFGVCLASSLALACGDDDDSSGPGGKGGSSGAAGMTSGAAAGADNQAGDGNPGNTGGSTGNTGGEADAPSMAGMPGEGGAGGATPDPKGFVAFVHGLIANETGETNGTMTVADKGFPDPKDEHGHYEAPATAFDDLF